MSQTTKMNFNVVTVIYLVFNTVVLGGQTVYQESTLVTEAEQTPLYNKYYGEIWQKLFPFLSKGKSSSNIPNLPYPDNTSTVESDTMTHNIINIDDEFDNSDRMRKSDDSNDVIPDVNLLGINSKSNQMRGWLFNTFEEPTTKAPVTPDVSNTLCVDDTKPIVLNKSVACTHNSLRKITLSDSQLIQYMDDEGANYVKDYMATDVPTAQSNFKNLISLTQTYEDINFKRQPVNWMWDYDMTKAKLLEQLEMSHIQLMSQALHESPSTTVNPKSTWQHLIKQTSSSFHSRHSNLIKAMHPSTMPCIASICLYPHRRRMKRAADGTTSTMEYCQNRGSESTDGYLHLCSMCAHTTTLPDDKFPRVINEAVCHATDSGCLFVGSTPHGSCRQNVFYMNMLRKKVGACMMVIHNGEAVLTDEWELYSQPIRVSCECLVNKRSPVASNVNPN